MGRDLSSGPHTLRTLVDEVERILAEAELVFGHGTDNARDEAAWLVLEALGRSPVAPVMDIEEPVAAQGVSAVQSLLHKRVDSRMPLAYLTGRAWFAGLEFAVDERSLVPRSPMAELIADRFEPWLMEAPVRRILDIGTGGGCIAVACALAFPDAHVDAADIDPGALALARHNIAFHGVGERVSIHSADVYAGLPSAQWDLIVSNPPYVDSDRMAALPREYGHEPQAALAGGPQGLDVIRRIIAGARSRLAPHGLLVVECGAAAAAVEAQWPRVPFAWPELDIGDAGIFVLPAADLP